MKRVLQAVSIIFILGGCGVYTFSGHGIGGISTIAVEPFGNNTSEFGIPDELTDAVITRLLRDRTLTVVEPGRADAILKGTIVGFSDDPFSFQETEEVTEYQITISADAFLIPPGRTEPLWRGRVVGKGRYSFRTGSSDERKEGIKIAVDQMVEDLVNRLTSDW